MASPVAPLTSILSGLIGGSSASKAGQIISQAGTSAANAVGTAGNQAAAATNTATQQGVAGIDNAVSSGQAGVNSAVNNANGVAGNLLGGQLSALSPYYNSGTSGTSIQQMLTSDPAAASAYLSQTPGYQFQLQQGLQGVEQSLAANGGANTGGALKALTQYGQGLAQNYYQNAFNNAQSMVNTGLQGASLGQQASENFGNTYNTNTMGGAYFNGNLGLSGANSAGQLNLSGAETAGNQNLQGTNLADQYFMQGAAGNAAGKLGSGSGLENVVGGAVNALGGIASYFM